MDALTDTNILVALLLTTAVGLSTGFGALISFFGKSTDKRLISGALGLSAGTMIFISFLELIPEAVDSLSTVWDGRLPVAVVMMAFFCGIAMIALIDWLVPEDENPHEAHSMAELSRPGNHHVKRSGMMLALAIGIHNFPEGMASFIVALDGVDVALPVIIAIAIHNIPEGMAVSVPIYESTGNRRKAVKYALISGFAEPVGAVVGLLFLYPFWTPVVNAVCLAAVAGVMVYIAVDELLPGAEAYGHHHVALAGVVLGMMMMAATMTLTA